VSYVLSGQLFGLLCAGCSEAVANTTIRLYRRSVEALTASAALRAGGSVGFASLAFRLTFLQAGAGGKGSLR
jgi:hypothetical protein